MLQVQHWQATCFRSFERQQLIFFSQFPSYEFNPVVAEHPVFELSAAEPQLAAQFKEVSESRSDESRLSYALQKSQMSFASSNYTGTNSIEPSACLKCVA